jgi:ribosomal protein S18 acetylase RimI-like enzyme
MIIETLKRWSISSGIMEMRLDVYYDNLAAIKAYEKAGFSKLMIQMRMRLGKN